MLACIQPYRHPRHLYFRNLEFLGIFFKKMWQVPLLSFAINEDRVKCIVLRLSTLNSAIQKFNNSNVLWNAVQCFAWISGTQGTRALAILNDLEIIFFRWENVFGFQVLDTGLYKQQIVCSVLPVALAPKALGHLPFRDSLQFWVDTAARICRQNWQCFGYKIICQFCTNICQNGD